MKSITPFANESDSVQLDDLTIENHVDRLAIYGSVNISLDKQGLETALFLKKLLDQTCATLQQRQKAGMLPDEAPVAKMGSVPNPLLGG